VAFTLLGAYLISRQITQRLGLGWVATVGLNLIWVIPLLNNSSIVLITAGIRASGDPAATVGIFIASVAFSTVVGSIMFWAGWRFGHRLAEAAKQPGAPAGALWNPKQIERAERWMETKGLFVVAFARATEFFTLPVNLVAGASEMPYIRFLVAHTVGACGFAGLTLWIGDLAKDRWPWLPDWIKDVFGPWAFRISIGLIVLLVIAIAIGQKAKPKAQPASEDGETTTPSQGGNESPVAD
jgi:membrane protein DedA with SNARE-associated domain